MIGGNNIAHEGDRKKCLCIQSMDLVIGKKKQIIFKRGSFYHCVIKGDKKTIRSFKIYGEEFDLSCSELEFLEYFKLVRKK